MFLFRNLFLISILIFSLILSGCVESDDDIDGERQYQFIPKPVNVSAIPDYSDIDFSNIATGVAIPPIPVLRNVTGFSYLESYSMMLSYLDETIDIPEVFASAGLGAPTICDTYSGYKNLRPMEGHFAYTQIRSMKNYGLNWVVGYAEEGETSTYIEDPYLEDVYGKLVYTAEKNTSLLNLKAVLNTGRPIQVHLDLYYLGNYDLKFQNTSENNSHYVMVTGYNETEIYITESYASEDNESEFKDMPIPVDTFLDAWYQGGRINGNTSAPTYWMLFFNERKYHDTISKPDFWEIIETQKHLSLGILEDFDFYISKINDEEYKVEDTNWLELAVVKKLFSEYLSDNVYDEEKVELYQTLYQNYVYCHNNPDQIKNMLNTIKENEKAAFDHVPIEEQ